MSCSHTPRPGKTQCQACADKNNARTKALYWSDLSASRKKAREYERARKIREPTRLRDARRRDPLNWLFTHARRRAKHAGLPFTITRKDLRCVPAVCPILGIPLAVAEGRTADGSPSIDRLDSSKGYVPGNAWVISHRANQVKSNGTAAEHTLIAEAMRVHGLRMKSHAWFGRNR